MGGLGFKACVGFVLSVLWKKFLHFEQRFAFGGDEYLEKAKHEKTLHEETDKT